MSATRVQVTGDRFHPVMPEGAVYVGRPAPFLKGHALANPHRVGKPCQVPACAGAVHDQGTAVRLYREHLLSRPDLLSLLPPLDGQMIACRCAPELPCHVDVLLELIGCPAATLVHTGKNP